MYTAFIFLSTPFITFFIFQMDCRELPVQAGFLLPRLSG